MSTRANIIVKDEYSALTFYRHSDGYPDGAMPTLEKFLDLVKEGKIRDNVGQASGWLIVLGREEDNGEVSIGMRMGFPEYDKMFGWKVGAIEPTSGLHGDIEHLYVIDLKAKTIKHHKIKFTENFDIIVPKGLPKQYYKERNE